MRHVDLSGSASAARPRRRPLGYSPWLGAAAALAGFAVVAAVGSWPQVVALNVEAIRTFQARFPVGSFDGVGLLLVLGASQVSIAVLAVAGVWLFLRGDRLVAVSFGIVLVGVAIEVLLKATLPHPMVWAEFSHGSGTYPFPEVKTTGIVTLQGPFPSGHVLRASYLAMTAVAVLGSGRRWKGRAAIAAAAGILVLGVLFGVLYLGWHWPTDALGSILLAYALTAPTRWAVAMRSESSAWLSSLWGRRRGVF